jgi:uncharacterized protein
MSISQDLLDIMECPLCHSALRAEGDAIACTRKECGLVYPVRDGIPVMLIDEAARACPSCGTTRNWDEKADALTCPKCGVRFTGGGGK